MKILSAFAPSQDLKDRFFSTTPTSLGWALAPLIAEIDAGNIPGLEYSPKVYDPLRVYPGIWEDFSGLLEKEKPDIFLVSSTYDSHASAIRLASLVKRFNPEALVIYGGPHVDEVANRDVISVMPHIYPFNEPDCPFDILIKGDGEMILLGIVKEAVRTKSMKGLIKYLTSGDADASLASTPGTFEVHIQPGNIISGSGRLINLSQLPFIPRKIFGHELDLYGFSCFREEDASGKVILLPSVSTMLHRGCRNFCIFCSERGGYLARSLDHISAELDGLVKAGIKGVFFDDSTFGDHENMDDLLACLRSFPLKYGSMNRFDVLAKPEFVEKLANSGFVYQYCAIEQFDGAVLRQNGKSQGLEMIRKGVANLGANGIHLGTSLLFGLKGETEDSIKATLDFVAAIDKFGLLDCVSMSLCSYHPGTPLVLGTKDGRAMHKSLQYNCVPPHSGFPWDCFEEGLWYHPSWVKEDSVAKILGRANDLFNNRLVRNMRKDGSLPK